MNSSDATRNWRRICEVALGVPATEGNEITVLRNGDEIFPAMLDAIENAERSIDMLTFIYWAGDIGRRFAEALASRARDGLRVRVMLDAVGARKLTDDLVELMRDGGVDVRYFRPVKDVEIADAVNRTHRKVLVCDETVGFTGGVGIADEWTGDARHEGEWRDTHVRVVGPAVDGLRAAFIDNWVEHEADFLDLDMDLCEPCQQPGDSVVQVVAGAGGLGQSKIATLYLLLFQQAQRRIRISTAYFTPTDEILAALCAAAKRGVDIQIVVPGPHADKTFMRVASEATFDDLLDAGVRIATFQPSMIHTKICIVDDEIATTGSANLDARGSGHDDEVNLVLFDRDVVETLVDHFENDFERSKPVELDEWRERGVFQRTIEALVDQVSGVL